MKLLAIAAAALLCCACATTSGTDATVTKSGFDGARVVNIAGHGNACGGTLCTGLGAQWSSKTPDSAMLTVYLFNDIKAIIGAKVNVDGEITDLRPTGIPIFSSRPIKETHVDVPVPLELVRRIASSKKTWLRVQTPDGYFEDAVVDGGTDSRALHALRRFLSAVDAGG